MKTLLNYFLSLFPTKEPRMWDHYCDVEKDFMETAVGEECNWCGRICYDKKDTDNHRQSS
ncbi:MAG: hypothetical protein CBD63_01760 [Candidatus Pelagibacter sp. TMED203]|nr:MAG: hypothetical protein CBD63_01760 [Candidatus Pelagibacter sp. TMED203]|tara:strand:- start:49 stop:228 length:180 start_codon:yes stop_codon:yes gene_type:complete